MKKLILFGALLSYPSLAYAYVDPGISAFIVQSIVGGIAVVSGMYFTFKQKLKALYKKVVRRRN